MIEKNLSKQIITIGPSIDSQKGGIGILLHIYKDLFADFKYIDTYKGDSIWSMTFNYVNALVQLLVRFKKDKNIKIVHVHGASRGSFLRKSIVILLSKMARKKVVYHIHGGGFDKFSNRHTFITNYVISKCDALISLSNNWKRIFEEKFHHPSIFVIPNTFSLPHEDHSIRRKDICTFLFLGKICEEKGIYDLIEVISSNKEKYKGKIKLLIGGNGEKDKLTKAIHELNLSDIVEFKGWVEDSIKAELFNLSDVFILPSYYEGVPISILEAFSYHIPAISTNVGGIPEILVDNFNGFLIQPGNKKEIEQAIDKFLSSDSQRLELGNNAYSTSLEYMPDKVECKLEHIYRKLIND